MYDKKFILDEVNNIRREIGHDEVNIYIEDIYFNEDSNELWIITEDRPDKSAIIGKGGWVVGKLREKLNLVSIHVDHLRKVFLRLLKTCVKLPHIQTYFLIRLPGLIGSHSLLGSSLIP